MIEYTKYIYPTPVEDGHQESPYFLSLSNSWSRKTINTVFSGSANLLDILQTKTIFSLPDENGNLITEKDLPDCLSDMDMFLEGWLNKQIILHIDFLLSLRLTKKES